MAGSGIRIQTTGIPELKRSLKQMDPALAKEFRSGFKKIAEKVAADIRPKVPHKSGRAAASVKGVAKGVGGGVAFGGAQAPYFPWLDFGGSTGRGHKPGVRDSGAIKNDPFMGPGPYKEGRYVYPTIREDHDMLMDEVGKMVEQTAHKVQLKAEGF
jgi:hypothetical protein